jgi:hypothetical protein
MSSTHVMPLLLVLLTSATARADKLVLIAGGGAGDENVPAKEARLHQPFGIAFDRAGNAYLVELKGERALRIDPKGILMVLAGTGTKGDSGDDGPAKKAMVNGMHSLAVAPDARSISPTPGTTASARSTPRPASSPPSPAPGKKAMSATAARPSMPSSAASIVSRSTTCSARCMSPISTIAASASST